MISKELIDQLSKLATDAMDYNGTAVNVTHSEFADNVTTTSDLDNITTTSYFLNSTQPAPSTAVLMNETNQATTTQNRLLGVTTSTDEFISKHHSSFHMLAIFTTAIFIAAILLIIKVIVSHNRKRRSLMTFGSASWRLSTSLSSAAPQARQSSAAYSPMSSDRPNVNSLDIPLPETRVDWERQFFDEDVYSHPVWDPSNRGRARLHIEGEPPHP